MAHIKLVSSKCEKYIVLCAGEIYWPICFHLYSPNSRLNKYKFSQQHFFFRWTKSVTQCESSCIVTPRYLTWNVGSIFWPLMQKLWCFVIAVFLFFYWDSLHARLNSHYKARSYKKKKHKNMKAYRKSV